MENELHFNKPSCICKFTKSAAKIACKARDWFFQNYRPRPEEGEIAPGTEGGTNFMMKKAGAGLSPADYGLLHEDLFFETRASSSAFERIRPGLQGRDMWKNHIF